MSEYSSISFQVDGPVATILLDRPDVGNAVNLEMANELGDAANRCRHDARVRVAVLSGNGKLFCAGGDIATMATAGEQVEAAVKKLAGVVHAAYSTFVRMDKPMITAVNGAAAGVGLSLALIGDLTLASEGASFTMAYTAVGLTPDGGASWLVPRIVGYKRAMEMMLTNRRLSAAEAQEWGLVNQVVPADALLGTAQDAAIRLAEGPTSAFGAVKRLMLSSFSESLEAQMVLEAESIGKQAMGPTGREGIRAFLEKRSPRFVD